MTEMAAAESEWEDGDLESLTACVCGSARLQQIYSDLADLEEGVSGRWAMSRCSDCNTLLLNPRPRPHALFKAYRSYYTHDAPVSENSMLVSEGRLASIVNSYISWRYGLRSDFAKASLATVARLLWPLRQQLDYFMRHLPRRPGRLLDVGCGSGGFLERARAADWECVGVEPDPLAASVARQQVEGVLVFDCLDQVGSNSFDVVTLAHVIEHVADREAMLRACLQALRPGGHIWLATPNIESFGHWLYRDAWQPLETPRHLIMAPARELQLLLERAGFVDVRFHNRGRGSTKRLIASSQRAVQLGRNKLAPRLLGLFVDGMASLSPRSAEELVITARRPMT